MTPRTITSRKNRINKKIVRDKDRKKMNDLLILFILLILVSVPGLLYLKNRIEYVRYQYKITELEHRKQTLLKNEKYLEAEKALLESSRTLEVEARRCFSLTPQNEGGCLIVVRLQDIQKDAPYMLTERNIDREVEKTLRSSQELHED